MTHLQVPQHNDTSLSTSQTFPLGSRTLFIASRKSSDSFTYELWVTDGTPAGTMRLPVCSDDSDCLDGVIFLTQLNGTAFFTTPGDGVEQGRLWRSDGTRSGTYELPLAGASYYGGVTILHGAVYFLASTQTAVQLWRSDGTQTATAIVPGFAATAFQSLMTLGDRLFLTGRLAPGDFGFGPQQLWTSDGTLQGTNAVPGFSADQLGNLVPVGKGIAFVATLANGANWQLWSSDGTAAGTLPLTNLTPPTQFDPYTTPSPLAVIGSRLYFVATDRSVGRQLWSTDMTPVGTRPITAFSGSDLGQPSQLEAWGKLLVLVTDSPLGDLLTLSPEAPASVAPLCPGGCGLFSRLTVAAHGLVFTRKFEVNDFDQVDLVSTDATPAGTVTVKTQVCTGVCTFPGYPLATVNGFVYVPVGNVLGYLALWQTDGTARGTRPAIDPARIGCGPLLGTVQGKLLVNGIAPFRNSPDLWVSDGTPGGTRQLTFENDLETTYPPSGLVGSAGRAYFLAGGSLFSSDGTAANTVQLTQDSYPRNPPVPVEGGVAFVAETGSQNDLWFSDGTPAGTRRLTTAAPASVAAQPLVGTAGKAYFVVQAAGGGAGGALWRTDGTSAGTVELFALPPTLTQVTSLAIFGGDLYFAGSGDGLSWSLWRSTGTPPRLTHLADFQEQEVDPALVQLGARVYFTVSRSYGEIESDLYATDGTPAGTRMIQFGVPSPAGVRDLTVAGQALYFFALPLQEQCVSPWRLGSDPSDVPRQVPMPVCLGGADSLTALAGGLAFSASDAVNGTELWWTDGTAAGTRLVRDINAGLPSSRPSFLAATPGALYFAADDSLHGVELWQSDGTAAGTHLVQDIAPGPDSSQPTSAALAGNFLFFTADDGLTGTQVWALPLGGPGGCRPSATALCLLGGRFRVDVAWDNFEGATIQSGIGQAAPLTDDTGTFWFFDPANVELVVKVLDGRGLNNSFWVFYGALSNVQYALTVTDTQTGLTRRYLNPFGQLASVGDPSAFGPDGPDAVRPTPAGIPLATSSSAATASGTAATGGAARTPSAPAASRAAGIGMSGTAETKGAAGTVGTAGMALTAGTARTLAASTGPCTPAPRRLCLDGNRFTVEANWTDFTGQSGVGRAVSLSPQTGYFWFFDAANVETMVKVVDGRQLNGKFWLFYGALSNVEYTLTVTDTATGTVKTYSNPAGQFASVADTAAF